MKVIKNKTIDFATAVQAPVINGNRAARTGYVRLVRLITDEPVPQQTSYFERDSFCISVFIRHDFLPNSLLITSAVNNCHHSW